MILTRWIAGLSVFFAIACGEAPESESQLQSDLLANQGFPTGPHEELTPGLLCTSPDEYRYPERIAYCKRNVASSLKNEVILTYDRRFQYSIAQMNRSDFKIDHYIPLCMGGDNRAENLWPQHKSVYEKTDRLEEKLCRLLNGARISQLEAVRTIKFAKRNLSQARAIEDRVDQML